MQALTAWAAMRDAAFSAVRLLQQLAVADPIRNMLYVRRGQEAAAMLLAANTGGVAAAALCAAAAAAAAAAPPQRAAEAASA